ncbi:MAG TPA: Crp/Fnr family transcriptional regulator [Candidatus Saccharimonadales bacterium]|nr:Crp/Fnr family transcriptional regulator [Candidatus Saccharimonadales bacterium]
MHELAAELERVAMRRTFKKHSILLYQGEAPRLAYMLKEGAVKAYTINSAGEEQIVTFHAGSDIFPSSWIFGKAAVTLYYYEALTDCEVLLVERDALLKLIATRPELAAEVLDYYATNYTALLMRVTALEQSRARDKIMFTLYYLLFRYGHETSPGKFTLDFSLTHSVIASLVGLTRETTTTELSKLKQEKVLEYAARTYTVDKPRLERLLGEDSFQDIDIR